MAPKRSKTSMDFDSNLFVSAKTAKLFRDVYSGSHLSHEYHLDTTLLGSNIACVGSWLRGIGLFDLLTTTNDVFPDLVAHFYSNPDCSIKSGTRINFPMLFFNHLHMKKKHSPYPVFLSRVFAFLHIHSSRDRRIHKSPQSTLSSDTLRRCKIIYQNNEWVRANQPPSDDDDDEEEHEDAPPTVPGDVPRLTGPSSSSRSTDSSWLDVMARMDILAENQATILANQQRQQEWMTARI